MQQQLEVGLRANRVGTEIGLTETAQMLNFSIKFMIQLKPKLQFKFTPRRGMGCSHFLGCFCPAISNSARALA
jgi:hypothetical protein